MNPTPLPAGGPSWAALPPEGARSSQAVLIRVGNYAWVEARIFELLGGWVPQIPDLDAKALVAEHAEHAAWRAQRWLETLPAAVADTGVLPPDGGVATFELAASLGDGGDHVLEKLAITSRVLMPRLLGAYTAHLDWASSVAEAWSRRLLAVVVTDLTADLLQGERLLQAAVAGDRDRLRAAAAVDALDEAVTAAGGLLGPGSVGKRPL